ncbi:adenine deaminase C-terminal domain-containing protein [Bacillus coahuilensis]|uniref:adenine deaminase C-terminal domain-containing protein n=1 Tax=Bacillus coahuilensis TaxID=408580 RepID=UPI000ADF3EA0
MGHPSQWKNKQIREHIDVIEGKISPTVLLKDATYLHSGFKKWIKGHIWIYEDRIIYAGPTLPENTEECEMIDCEKLTIVPGYIEPHVHPFQLYNPHSFAQYASKTGTTTLINDNLMFFLLNNKKKAFSLLDSYKHLPVSMFWWCRFDSQSEMENEEKIFSLEAVKTWLKRDDVIQGGELTSWPRLVQGDDMILQWIQETKKLGKKVEGHFPGASERTLAMMSLFGVDSDHESMTGKEAYQRILHGFTVALRHSSIRKDLEKLLDELKELEVDHYRSLMLTTDGSTPSFYKNGVIDFLLRICLEKGIPAIDAYEMASYNVASYYGLSATHGSIATGQIANINILENPTNPTPIGVLSKGQWVVHPQKSVSVWDDEIQQSLPDMKIDWELKADDMQFSMPFGMKLVNDVITKPYSVQIDASLEELSLEHDHSYLLLLDRHGKWRISTMIQGFSSGVKGLASSFTGTGDIVIIGKNRKDMIRAFNEMKRLNGGIVVVEDEEIIFELPLPFMGVMSDLPMEELIEKQEELQFILRERGYDHSDPVYTLLFLTSTHLPYIRITPKGIYDVMKKTYSFLL